ncbi:MAG: hypothetical protein ACRETL_11085, partial [Gammaproteobacteria bacterium]
MSPGSMGTLEFSTLYPYVLDSNQKIPAGKYPGIPTSHWQFMTFTRNDASSNGKGGTFLPSMQLTSRAGRGLWEPKVTSGYGYTVAVAPIKKSGQYPESSGKSGIANWIDVGMADIVDPNISASHPFFVRLGICYSNTNGTHPQDPTKFLIKRGYKSFTGGLVEPSNADLLNYWSGNLPCNNIDVNNPNNIPYEGNESNPACPSTGPGGDSSPGPAYYTMSSQDNISALTNQDGTPNLKNFFYDTATGMLYLNVAQEEPNPVGPSPTGSCNADGTGDPSCPDLAANETYYACPKNGCIVYTIAETDKNYRPGKSTCTPDVAYGITSPSGANQLVLYD